MPTSLGISVGASGVGSALRTDAPDGRTIEYRRVAADSESGRDLGDLVFDAISLTARRHGMSPSPENVTVAYRTEEQAEIVRRAAERQGHLLRLVPETTAVLSYLRTVGVRPENGAVALVDIGASGTTVSIVDQKSGEVLRWARTEDVSGNELGTRVYDHVRHATERLRTRRQIDPDLLAARCQGAQDALVAAHATRIDIVEAGPDVSVTLTRSDIDELTADLAETATAFTRRICTRTLPVPRTLALVGGAAAAPALAEAISTAFDGETVSVPEPGAAAALGAALLGDSTSSSGFPVVGSVSGRGTGSSRRISGTVAGVLVLSAVLAGFATQHFTGRDTSDAPVAPLLTSGAAPTPDSTTEENRAPLSSEVVIPSHDPDPDPVSTATDGDDLLPPETVPWPTLQSATPSTTAVPTGSVPPATTVTPTPIDQVPTPGQSTTPNSTTRPTPPSTTSPDSETSPRPDPTTAPVTTPEPTDPTSTPPTTTPPEPSPSASPSVSAPPSTPESPSAAPTTGVPTSGTEITTETGTRTGTTTSVEVSGQSTI